VEVKEFFFALVYVVTFETSSEFFIFIKSKKADGTHFFLLLYFRERKTQEQMNSRSSHF